MKAEIYYTAGEVKEYMGEVSLADIIKIDESFKAVPHYDENGCAVKYEGYSYTHEDNKTKVLFIINDTE
jgi:hypothetical protein